MYGDEKITSPALANVKRAFLAALAVGLIFSGCARQKQMSAQDHLRKAQALIQAGDYEAAYLQLSEALAQSPEDPMIHQNLGWVYLYTGEVDKAQQELRQLAAVRPKAQGTFHLRGALYDDLGQYNDALSNYNQALKVGDATPRLLFDVAETQAHLNENEAALDTLEKGFDAIPDEDATTQLNYLFAICTAQSRLKHFEDAIETCEQARELSPSPEEQERVNDFIHNMKLIELIDEPADAATAADSSDDTDASH